MGDITSPQTYGEHYFALDLESKKAFSEIGEKQYGPIIADIFTANGWDEIMPPSLKPLFDILKSPPSPSWDEIQKPFLGVVSRAVALAGGEQMAKPFEYEAHEKYLAERIGANTAITLFHRKKITEDLYKHRMHSSGYADDEAKHLNESLKPYPSMTELIRYGRYNSSPDNPKPFVWELFDVSPDDWSMWEWLSLQKLSTEQTQQLFRRGNFDEALAIGELSKLGWVGGDRKALLDLAYEVPNAMLLIQGDIYHGITGDKLTADVVTAGIHPDYAQRYIDGVLTKPNSEDIVAHQLRFDPTLNGLDDELRKVGIHPDYLPLYKTLAHPIPPVNDLITMAVREAFTPDIARRFGQYQDLPKEYVDAAAQKGLTKEWAERYWAAHWDLPSIQQGFAMLHRGIITEADLSMLLRALDIMPFWRDKLMALSYKPLTRVDVRRMHQLGTLDDDGVKKAYKDVGYNDYNAAKMTDFTIRYNRRVLSGFTQRDAVTAYINRLIEAGECRRLLGVIGTKSNEIGNIMALASNKRNWKMKTERTDAISNLYRKGKLDESQARSQLNGLGYPSDYTKALLEQWEAKSEADKTATFTNAQTLKLFSAKLITEDRAREELILLGFNTERRDLLIKSVQE